MTHLHVGLPGANPNLSDKDVAQFKLRVGDCNIFRAKVPKGEKAKALLKENGQMLEEEV